MSCFHRAIPSAFWIVSVVMNSKLSFGSRAECVMLKSCIFLSDGNNGSMCRFPVLSEVTNDW